MRHYLANIATVTIATFLIVGAALFAWMRTAQIVIADEATLLGRYAPAAERAGWLELGQRSYASNCSNCHGRDGTGWDQYPGVGHTSRLFSLPGGREYIIDVHLYGLTSERWRAPMPPMGHINDIELAAVLNYVLTHFGNQQHLPPDAALYLPEQVGIRRGQGASPRDVNARRPAFKR
jgi:mono/diheme cytochrome c family protein